MTCLLPSSGKLSIQIDRLRFFFFLFENKRAFG